MKDRIARAARSLANRLEPPPAPKKEKNSALRNIKVVISGAPFEVPANPNWKIAQLMREGLKRAGITPPNEYGDIAGWTLRGKHGVEVNPGVFVHELPKATEILYLDIDEGGGGSAERTFETDEERMAYLFHQSPA